MLINSSRNAVTQQAQPIPVTAPAPLDVRVVNAPKFRTPYNLNISLNPGDPRPLGPADGLCFIGGELPYILVHNQGQVMRIERGQFIPTMGRDVAVENPFERLGSAQITVNATGPQGGNSDGGVWSNRYHGTATLSSNLRTNKGLLFFPVGEQRLSLYYNANSSFTKLTMIPNVLENFESLAPGSVIVGERTAYHSSGQSLKSVRILDLSYTNNLEQIWLEAAGLNEQSIIQVSQRQHAQDIRMDPGTAIFVVLKNSDEEFICDYRLSDEGRLTSGAVC
ncbi:TPA_inf: hypothetical protein gp_06 [Marinomonas phage YY]|nr:TPA_inf: hypothetical protein gp_06 [Marinomonas phage YY]